MLKSYHNPILVIEDNDEDFAMVCQGLENVGVHSNIIRLENTKQVQQWIDKQDAKASLIILDLNLPSGSGHALVPLFKNHEAHKLTPVVVFSTSSSQTDIQKSYALGVNSYHCKPLETPNFHKIVSDMADYWLGKALLAGAV